jgi:hypothetical protein
MKKALFILLCILLMWACKDKDENTTQFRLNIPEVVHIGDSIKIGVVNNNASVRFSLMPNAGFVSDGMYYVAPPTLAADSLVVALMATSANEMASQNIRVIRGDRPDSTLSYKEVIEPLLSANCNFSGCHGNGSRAGGVNLENYTSTLSWVDAYRPLNSLLYLSLIKHDPLRRMPPAGPLHSYKIKQVSIWIEQGALQN